MYLSRFFLPLFVTSVIASTYQSVATDLQKLNNDTIALTATIKAYDGNGGRWLVWRNAQKLVIQDVRNTQTDLNNLFPAFTVAQYTTLYGFVNGTLYDNTKGYLAALVSKKQVILTAGLKYEFCKYTSDYKAAYDSCSDVFIAKAPSADLKNKAVASKAAYDSQFNSAASNLGC